MSKITCTQRISTASSNILHHMSEFLFLTFKCTLDISVNALNGAKWEHPKWPAVNWLNMRHSGLNIKCTLSASLPCGITAALTFSRSQMGFTSTHTFMQSSDFMTVTLPLKEYFSEAPRHRDRATYWFTLATGRPLRPGQTPVSLLSRLTGGSDQTN